MRISLFKLGFAGLLGLSVSACTLTPEQITQANSLVANYRDCSARGGSNCYFVNSPVVLSTKSVRLPGRELAFYALARNMEFIDGENRRWVAARGTLTDGASIPPLFVPLVGNPRTTEFANASALHDAYCGVGNEAGPNYHADSWQNVHRMFYDSLVVGGTPQTKAKVMFSAVWLGGPRWSKIGAGQSLGLPGASDTDKIGALKGAIAFIGAQNRMRRLCPIDLAATVNF